MEHLRGPAGVFVISSDVHCVSVKCSYQLMLWIMHNWVLCFWMVICKERPKSVLLSFSQLCNLSTVTS